MSDKQTIFVGVTALAIGIGVYLASGDYKTSGGGTPPAVTPPTTTTGATTR